MSDFNNTGATYGAGQPGYNSGNNLPAGHENTPGREGVADKIANAIPGHTTGAPGSMPGSNNPSAHDHAGHGHSSTGAGYGGNTHTTGTGAGFGNTTSTTGAGYGGASTTGAGYGTTGTGAYDNTNTGGLTGSHHQHGTAGGLGGHSSSTTHGTHGTHGTHADAPGAGFQGSGREGMADKVANAVPGHTTGAPGSMPGSNNPKEPHSSTTHSHGTTGSGLTGGYHHADEHRGPIDTHQNEGGYAAGTRVHQGEGTAHHGTHGHHDSHATTHGTHGTHGTHSSTTTGAGVPAGADHKPSMGEKIGGKIESLIGKATKNEAKVAEGEAKAAGVDTTGTHGATNTTANRY